MLDSIINDVTLEGVKTLIVTADGQKLLSGGSDGKITVYDINNGDGFENIKSGFGKSSLYKMV